MLEKLSPKNKKVIMVLLMAMVVYLAYVFSFEKAISAVALNRQLKQTEHIGQEPDAAFPQLEKKHAFYQAVLKGYKVRREDRENRLWQSISAMAIAKNVDINFSPNLGNVEKDTSELARGIVVQKFIFKGKYFDMVKLLDTLEKSQGIGRISGAKLMKKKENGSEEKSDKLTLELQIVGKEN
ncbi:hypothetical protein SRABI27_04858 [Pedobacter sp. Bi27]|uniref:hypothetical protein n=1 Tax=unclassified Pedobacter TaxID=2628915 RepID=UPI001D558403|nr:MULTISPECIES: hypothetical protein [unclassified Pedobacter]CAH0304185.1 hypothetical protein SRABI36_04749 [Pedobacter sp. Bi36]CAH0312793.1 hypothetical protein SRABI27_04858 [Pedobacter sp. Bi27]CAH0313353.1 hypothetical protein SRABI126_04873 [Pedobacter sp. Bi126]